MKVLHVIDSLGVGGGAEHSLASVLPLLRDRGVESSIATLRSRGFGLEVQIASQGFSVEVLPTKSWLSRMRSLRRKIKTERPDLVHATLFNSCMIARFACIGLRVPLLNSLVLTSYDRARVEGIGTAEWKIRIVRFVDGFTGRHLANHFHALTRAVQREGIDLLGLDPTKITVIPRGRSAAALGMPSAARRAAARSRLGFADDVPLVLNVGRQDHQKAHAHLVRAFAKVLEQQPDAVLLIAGREGDASKGLNLALEQTGLGDAVRLLGDRSDVADLLAATDIFVFPSLYEGLGGSILEAMALGVPVIGSDAVAVAEVLGNGEFGPVITRGDESALAQAIIDLLQNPEQRRILGARGRDHFLTSYQIEQVADATVELYQQLIAD